MALKPVYSALLLNETWTGGDKVLAAPAGTVVVIRDILAREASGVVNSAINWMAPNGGPVYLFIRATSTDLGIYHWTGRAVLSPGNTTWWHVVAGTWTIWVSGYLLTQ